jgi:hypothetical protein
MSKDFARGRSLEYRFSRMSSNLSFLVLLNYAGFELSILTLTAYSSFGMNSAANLRWNNGADFPRFSTWEATKLRSFVPLKSPSILSNIFWNPFS